MKHTLWQLMILVGGIVLAGCQSADSVLPTAAVRTTPAADIQLVNEALPTSVPMEIISVADAEYALLTNIYQRLAPSIVNIEVLTSSETALLLGGGRGSGFIYDTLGHIVTNAHVVDGAAEIEVTFQDGYIAYAAIVGMDAFSDLAVLRVDVDRSRLIPVTLADSDLVQVGQRAIAIGNPFGLASSMTLGIVSGLGRQLPSAQLLNANLPAGFSNPSIIQVDADINPGNSGGPLLDSSGELIGVNTAIRSENGVFQGVGFAIPANTVRRVIPELIADGEVNYTWIGISTLREEDGFGVAALAEPLDLMVSSGVLVDRVAIDSPADKAGLQGGTTSKVVRGTAICTGGDIIVAINGQFVRNLDELLAYLLVNTHPGDVVNLMIVRDNETFELPLTLEARPTTSTGEGVNGCM